jgi:hypothetical protein
MGVFVQHGSGEHVRFEALRGSDKLVLDLVTVEQTDEADRLSDFVDASKDAIQPLGVLGITVDRRLEIGPPRAARKNPASSGPSNSSGPGRQASRGTRCKNTMTALPDLLGGCAQYREAFVRRLPCWGNELTRSMQTHPRRPPRRPSRCSRRKLAFAGRSLPINDCRLSS